MSKFSDAPISRKLTLSFIGMSVSAVLLASIVFLAYDWITQRQAMVDDLASLSAVIGNNSTAALTFNDPNTATEVLGALRARPQIQIACIYLSSEASNRSFASYHQNAVELECPPRPDTTELIFTTQHMSYSIPVMLDEEVIGSLYIRKDLSELWDKVTLHLEVVLGVILASLGLSLFIASLLQRGLTKPIISLANTAQNIAESKNYSLRAISSGKDEVGQLILHFNSMLAEIEDRDDEVVQAREELQAQVEQTTQAYNQQQITMQRLIETQKQLVQTEKMASLGGLVAGVAHEINTPVGVGVTAASTLLTRSKELEKQYKAQELTATALSQYVAMAVQSSGIILKNLSNAAELIHSFKQVAVDQTSSERREFNLAEYIDEVLLSLRPKLKTTHHNIEVECPPDIELYSYPGAISQILTNFIMNSLIHGFEGKNDGHINIKVERVSNEIHLHYADDGTGIAEEYKKKIFDPFFTTKRGSGGSGLGLHVVYNLVTHTLNGQIAMESEAGKGISYNIVFPMQEGLSHGNRASNE